MKFDVTIFPDHLNEAGKLAEQVEAYGFKGLWTAEAAHNPFLPLTHAASRTRKISLGTGIAIAFPRSPMVTAQIAWDLAAQSEGRFILGMGTQIKAHITKRFGMDWTAPVPRLREYVESLHAIWNCFQTGEKLHYKGESYQFSLMTPFFNPGPIANPKIPIYIAGVNHGLCRLAGELTEGFHIHPFHTKAYLEQNILPAIQEGAEAKGRSLADIERSCAIFVVTGNNPDEIEQNKIAIKSQIAFYASTPSYSPVLELHGWQDIVPRLNNLLRRNQWDEMWREISDEMLQAFAVIAPPDELPAAVEERYQGLLDRVGYYFPFNPDEADKASIWKAASDYFGGD
ncbi:LLM class F420-dependent oxidoreductase [Anaerolineales bacterium]